MRRRFDFYETGREATRALLDRVNIGSLVLEPCSGKGAIAEELRGGRVVVTNDINPDMPADRHDDACLAAPGFEGDVITNPPYSDAFRIVRHFVERKNRCAFLLRLSWSEPTLERGQWLNDNPMSGLIVLPRYSYTGNGKTDSVTSAWHLWGFRMEPPIQVVPR